MAALNNYITFICLSLPSSHCIYYYASIYLPQKETYSKIWLDSCGLIEFEYLQKLIDIAQKKEIQTLFSSIEHNIIGPLSYWPGIETLKINETKQNIFKRLKVNVECICAIFVASSANSN